MTMRRMVSVVVIVFLVGSLMVVGVDGADADDVEQCYVIGDTSGNQGSGLLGSKKNPYGTLAQVEADLDCVKITVLYSDAALDGGIQLDDGQELIGKKGPGRALPVVTNSSTANHDGAAVVLADHNVVRGIHIENPLGHGIFGQNVTGTDIHGVRITNHNSGNLPPTFSLGGFFPGGREGIHIESNGVPGTHSIKKVSVSDSGSTGIGIIGTNGGNVQVEVTSTSIEEITGFTGTSNHPGLLAVAFGPGTIVDINLENLSVDNVTSYSSGALLISSFGGALNTNISGYDYQYSRGIYSTDFRDFPRYGIESSDGPGSINHVMMEYSRITGASGAAYVAFDPCDPFNPFLPCDDPHSGSIVDLGGGPLGSDGQNSIHGNGIQGYPPQQVIPGFDLIALNAVIHAENNWWGTTDPAEITARMLPGGFGWGGDIDYTPFLIENPQDG